MSKWRMDNMALMYLAKINLTAGIFDVYDNKLNLDDVKQKIFDICNSNGWNIIAMETDKDHIHYMIETEPTMSVSKIVNLMKSYTTYHIWKRYPNYLRKHFWKEHTFWTDGYFACSVGNVSEEMLKKYIENQG